MLSETELNNSRRKKTNKKSSAASAGRKKSTAGTSVKRRRKKMTAAERRELEARESFLGKESAFIGVCFAALFLFLSNFGLFGKAGSFAGGFQKGLFGFAAYAFPVFLILIVLFCIRERKTPVFWMKIGSDLILTVCTCTILHLAFGSENRMSFAAYYEAGKNGELFHKAAGGAVGGFVGDALRASLAGAGAWLLILTLTLLCLVVITEKSIISAAKRSAEKASETARAGSRYARDRFNEEKIRLEAKREAAQLRRKEARMEESLREQEAVMPSPGSSVFDLKEERSKAFSVFGTELTGEDGTGSEVSLNPDRIPVTPASDASGGAETAQLPETGFCDSDEVPFDETEEEKYRAYGRMLSGGKIDLNSAQRMGFAVSREVGTRSGERRSAEPGPGRQMKAFEETQDLRKKPELCPGPESHEELRNAAAECGTEYPENIYVELSPAETQAPAEEAEIVFPEPYETPGEEASEAASAGKSGIPDLVPGYDDMYHITDEDRAEVYDGRERAAKTDTAFTPFGSGKISPAMRGKDGFAEAPGNKCGTETQTGKRTGAAAPAVPKRPYQFPPVGLLKKGNKAVGGDRDEMRENAGKLERVLSEFGVGVTVTNVVKGPRVTRYEMTPDIGVKVSRITSLSGDIKLAMAASELRIEAPIPGKSAVGIEVPNKESSTVTFRDIMESDAFGNAKSKLAWGVGLDIQGSPIIGDIAKMPHLLVSGTTGSGKSVGINSIIMSVIYRAKPEEVRLILVDPKVVELSVYDGIPHLLAPVVTDAGQALAVLNKACAEMANRYNLFRESNTRNIAGYNEKVEEVSRSLPPEAEKPEKLPYILIIIDELSELMMHSKKDVETAIVSLTQLARAAGIHLVAATQRPSVDVVTGLIKSNIPSRVAFKLPSGIDSRTVLDTYGAENLLGNGDMLFKPGNLNSPLRVQGAYLSDGEVESVVEWLKKHNSADYHDDWQNLKAGAEQGQEISAGTEGSDSDDGRDPFFFEAGLLITEKKKASIGMLQRKFKVGFNRAARIMDQLNEAGVVSGGEGTKERQILMTEEEFRERF